LLQPDGHVVGQHAAVEDERHDRPGPLTCWRRPIDGQQRTGNQVDAEFLGDLAAAAGMRRLAVVEDPARQRPVVTVVRLDQQNLPGPVGEQRRRGAVHGGQPGVPRGLLGGGEAGSGAVSMLGHGHDPIRPARPAVAPVVR
jgi:hypothetical protein